MRTQATTPKRQTTCTRQGCTRVVKCAGLCSTHFERARKGDTRLEIRDHKRGVFTCCTVPGCGRPHSAQGFCSTHYEQDRHGRPIKEPRPYTRSNARSERCLYPKCKASVHSRGWCAKHYGRTISQHARDLILVLQDGRCLCGTTDPGKPGWHLDHDHNCEQHTSSRYCLHCVRGLICHVCNTKGLAWHDKWIAQGNEPFPPLQNWTQRRIVFHGDPLTLDVTVTLDLSRATTGHGEAAADVGPACHSRDTNGGRGNS